MKDDSVYLTIEPKHRLRTSPYCAVCEDFRDCSCESAFPCWYDARPRLQGFFPNSKFAMGIVARFIYELRWAGIDPADYVATLHDDDEEC